ncbi:hypothetical protein GCM10009722_30360 [Williamsia deligens]
MLAPVRGVPQLDPPTLPWTEITEVDLGPRGRLRVRHTPGLHDATQPPVVLLHGVTLTGDLNFFALADLFDGGRPAIVFDLPNHGDGIDVRRFVFTELADDIVAVLDHLGVSQAILCGYSLGGITAMVTADRHPSRIAGILVQAAAMRYGVDIRERVFLQGVTAVHRLRLDQATRTLPARYWRVAARRSPHAAARWQWINRQMTVTGRARLATVFAAVGRTDHRRLRPAAPVVVTLLRSDRVCPPRLQREAARLLSAHVIEADADHDLPVADPDRYVRLTASALDHIDRRIRDGAGPRTGPGRDGS